MKLQRALVAAAVAITFVSASAGAASAAVPSNDTVGGATPVTLGFSEVLDTTEATTDADDVALNASCAAPATEASVWYTYTAATSGGVVVDLSGSNFPAGVIVATGTPGSLTNLRCGPFAVTFAADAGTTYHVLAFDFQGGGANGGSLAISFTEAPPPPTIELTVDPVGYVTKAGTALLAGTYTCTDAAFVGIFGDLSQLVGRFEIEGRFAFGTAGCDGTPQPWSAEVYPTNGKFAGGRSAAVTFGFACGGTHCALDFAEQRVYLRGMKR